MKYLYHNQKLHTERTAAKAGITDECKPVTIAPEQGPAAIGCVLRYKYSDLFVSGRPQQGAQLSADLPPRLYLTADRARIALYTLNWPRNEYDIEWVML